MVRDKYPKLYIYFFLCCRKDRWVRENIQRAKNEKNEYMIAKIEDIQYFMKDMKSMYINHINYEGHDDFMKLLYIIEDMKPKIDMTIKKNEFKVDGKIARERRFDPENLNKALDDKKLEINESFESRGSYSNSESIGKKKGIKSSQLNDVQSEKFIPESKDDLLKHFSKRQNIRKINKDHAKIYDILGNVNRDFTPHPNIEEEEKMHQLEDYFKHKFKDPTAGKMYRRENTSSLVEPQSAKRSMYSTQQPEPSLDDEENTTAQQILQQSNEYPQDMSMHDNYMNKIKMSRNAKVLMKKSKEAPTGVDLSYKMNPAFNLPKGEEIPESDLKVRDYDEEEKVGQASKELVKDKPKLPGSRDDMVVKAKDDQNLDVGLSKVIRESFQLLKKPIPKIDLKKELTVNREESKESSLSVRSKDSREPPRRHTSSQRSALAHLHLKTNNLMAPVPEEGNPIQRRRSKIIQLKEASSTKSIGINFL